VVEKHLAAAGHHTIADFALHAYTHVAHECDRRVVAEEVAELTAHEFLAADTVAMIKRENALKLFPLRTVQFGWTAVMPLAHGPPAL
jgi:hypothetical protein